jgi:Uncharacterized protein conserved in bacteria
MSSEIMICPLCNGSGRDNEKLQGHFRVFGGGFIPPYTCDYCNGKKYVPNNNKKFEELQTRITQLEKYNSLGAENWRELVLDSVTNKP